MQFEASDIVNSGQPDNKQAASEDLYEQFSDLTTLQRHYLVQFVFSLFDDASDPMKVEQNE